MIKFFRNIRKSLIENNRMKKYSLYAFGEIFLVVIGILIALQINNWNEAGKLQTKEKNLLVELKGNLESNITNLESDINIQIRSAKRIDFLIDHLDKKKPYHDSLSALFQDADFAPDVILAASAFETLKSTGLDILTSDRLRQEIINLFEISYPYMLQETKRLENQFWPSIVLPLYTKHFRRSTESGLCIPTDYKALLRDTEFINMLSTRGNLRKGSTYIKKKTIQKTLTIIELIEKEIKEKD